MVTERDVVDICAENARRLPPGSRSIYQRVWLAATKLLAREAGKGRKVTLPGIGSIFHTQGRYVFRPGARFVAAGGLRTQPGPDPDPGTLETEVKPSVLARSTGLQEDAVKGAYEDLFDALCEVARREPNVTLNFLVVKVQIAGGQISCSPLGSRSLSARHSRAASTAPSMPASARASARDPAITKQQLVSMHGRYDNLEDHEIEKALKRRPMRGVAASKPSPRDVLQDNRMQQRHRLEEEERQRLQSRDQERAILHSDNLELQREAQKLAHRRAEQEQLATQYKKAIHHRETHRLERHEHLQGPPMNHFPFTSGELYEESARTLQVQRKQELTQHMKEQTAKRPMRMDPVIAAASHKYTTVYPLDHVGGAEQEANTIKNALTGLQQDEHPNFQSYPKMFQRPKAYMSRRIVDGHVKQALHDEIAREADTLGKELVTRVRQHQDERNGMLLNDALRLENEIALQHERSQTQDFVKQQMHERQQRRQNEKIEQKLEPGYYYGPDEKELAGRQGRFRHQQELQRQMEVDKDRRLESRERRIQVENQMCDNALNSLIEETSEDVRRQRENRVALQKMWDHQVKQSMVRKKIDEMY